MDEDDSFLSNSYVGEDHEDITSTTPPTTTAGFRNPIFQQFSNATSNQGGDESGRGSGGGSGRGTRTTISPLEREVLDEYRRLLGNMNALSSTLSTLSSGPITLEIAEGLRLLERKVASVHTLMKASVYSIVLQQGQMDGEGETTMMAANDDRDAEGHQTTLLSMR